MNNETTPEAKRATESHSEKSLRIGLGITSSLALFGGGGMLVLGLALMLMTYLYSLFTGVPFSQLLE